MRTPHAARWQGVDFLTPPVLIIKKSLHKPFSQRVRSFVREPVWPGDEAPGQSAHGPRFHSTSALLSLRKALVEEYCHVAFPTMSENLK